MSTDISFFSCQRTDDGRWQVHLRGEGRGWTTAQAKFDHPVPALFHALEQYAGVHDAKAMLIRQIGPEFLHTTAKINTEDLF